MLIRKVSVMNGKPFVCAYSKRRFREACHTGIYPDHTFHSQGDMHWCVRVGDITVPWGFGDCGGGYSANGTVTLSRLNVDEASFCGRGLPFRKDGEIFYLYESELTETGFEGFAPFIRDRIVPHLKILSHTVDERSFTQAVQGIRNNPDVIALMREHKLTVKTVTVDKITKTINDKENVKDANQY